MGPKCSLRSQADNDPHAQIELTNPVHPALALCGVATCTRGTCTAFDSSDFKLRSRASVHTTRHESLSLALGHQAVWALALFACLHGPARVWADEPVESATNEPEAKSEYDLIVAQAIEAYAGDDFAEAHALFERANALAPNARALRGMGVASFRANHFATALRELEAALSHPEKPLGDELRKDVEDVLARAKAQVLILSLRITPDEAQVSVDSGEPITTRDALVLDPGPHTLRFVADGFEERRIQVQALSGSRETLQVELVPHVVVKPALDPRKGRAASAVDDAAAYSLDPQQRHRLRVLTMWSTAGLSLAAVGTSVGLFLGAQHRIDSVASECRKSTAGSCSFAERDRLLKSARVTAFERSITASIAIAAVAGATSLATLTWEYFENGRRLDVRLSATSVSLRGTF